MAEIIQLNTRRPLAGQFQMAANMLDDFVIEDYRIASIVERERILLDLSDDMLSQIPNISSCNEATQNEFKEAIFRGLTYGFNNMFCIPFPPLGHEEWQQNLNELKESLSQSMTIKLKEISPQITG